MKRLTYAVTLFLLTTGLVTTSHWLTPERLLGKEVYSPQELTLTSSEITSVAVKEIDKIGFTVSNLDEAIVFFTEALEFKKIAEFELSGLEFDTLTGIPNSKVKIAQLKLGDQILELTQYLTPKGRPIPVPSYSNDLSFQHIAIVVRDMDKAYNHLRQFKIRSISPEPQTIPPENKEAAGIRAFKFTDTDGHPLELLYFPSDKGKAIWHRPSDRLFLGIDHTAISISNTSQSLDFYQKVLEMKVLGQGTNSGITQEKLDNLPNVRVFITAITPPKIVPSVEFLDYKSPPRKQSKPIDIKVNDLLSWQTTIVVDDAELAYKTLQKNITTQLISPKVVTFSDPKLGFKKAFLLKDTDGHILRFIEK